MSKLECLDYVSKVNILYTKIEIETNINLKIIFGKNPNFNIIEEFELGDYDDIESLGFKNNLGISSINIPDGLTLIIYRNKNFKGDFEEFIGPNIIENLDFIVGNFVLGSRLCNNYFILLFMKF